MAGIIFKFSALGSAYGIALGTESDADPDCQDTNGFRDVLDYECSGWEGYNCRDVDTAAGWGYSAADMVAVQENCPFSCSFCGTESHGDPECKDTDGFTDVFGYGCSEWVAYGCDVVVASSFDDQIESVLENCRMSCSLCDGHVRPSPERNIILLGGDPFDREKYSAGLAAGGVDGFDLSDTPFYPEILYNGEYYPICGIDFNDEAASTACRDIDRFNEAWLKKDQPVHQLERFTYGGRVVQTNAILEQDAMPVGACLRGESLDGCTAGGNAFGDLEALDGRCKKGNPVGVQIVCQRQCRKFGQRVFTEEQRKHADEWGLNQFLESQYESVYELEACNPFLRNTTTYYLTDRMAMVDQSYFGNRISEFAALLDVMGQRCSANVVEIICHTVFKECKEVDFEDAITGGMSSVMLPSLLCKSECERHKAIWDECFENIKKDSSDKELFESNMQAMSNLMSDVHKEMTGKELPKGEDGTRSPFSLLDCDAKGGNVVDEIPDEEVAASWILGRYPQTDFVRDAESQFPYGIVGWAFPRFMTSEMLYPEEFSTYTGPDGVSYEVPCTVPSQSAILKDITCPSPFVNSILPETNRACVYGCPMDQFSEGEYTTMWTVFVVIGMCSFILNMFMVATWKLGGWRQFQATPFQLKSCVFLGLLYGIVETIPTLILKFDLPCKHPTEEEIGNSAICSVNRSGQYFLLGIMVNLCTLTIMIYRALLNSTGHENNVAVNVFSTAAPLLFMVIAYGLDTDEEDVDNYYLNVSRHGFNCSMRFSSMLEEWLVLWLPFCTTCLLTAVFSVASWWKIGDIQRGLGMMRPGASNVQTEGQKKLAGQRRRLIRIAATVSACLLLSIALVGQATVEQTAWTDYENNKFDCLTKTSGTRNFKDYGFSDKDVVEDICSIPAGDNCEETAAILLLFMPVEGGQSFIPTCGWYPHKSTTSLMCSTDDFADLYRNEYDDQPKKFEEAFGSEYNDFIDEVESASLPCGCTCPDLFDKIGGSVERPSPVAMILSFASQSLVAAVVALNLGLRDDHLDLWRTFFKKTFGMRTNTVAATGPDDGFQFDSKAYERDDSSASD